MTRPLSFATLAVCLAAEAGCASSRIPMTQELRARHNLSDEELKSLQYYTSDTITLRRVLRTTGKQITDGHKLVLRSGERVEEVVIEAGTPGAAVDVGPNYITVSFEADTSITFALRGAHVPERVWERGSLLNASADPFPGNPGRRPRSEPRSEPADGSGNFWIHVPGSDGRIPFAGTWFDVVDESLRAHLEIDAEDLEEEEEAERVLGGVRL